MKSSSIELVDCDGGLISIPTISRWSLVITIGDGGAEVVVVEPPNW